MVRFVGSYTGRIGRGDTGNNELFVDVDSTADRVSDLEHFPHPHSVFEDTGRDWALS